MIINNCRFIPELVEGFFNNSGSIKITDGIIVEISDEKITAEKYECVIDAGGKTVMPGLIDMHIHLGVSGDDVFADNAKSLPYRTLEGYKFAVDTLKSGFTTVRDVGDVDYLAIAIRDIVKNGNLIGPTIHASGRIVTPTENGNDYFKGMYNEADSTDEVRKAARQEFKSGAEFLKTMISGAISNPGGEPGMTISTKEELSVLVRCAKERNTYVAAHCHSVHSILLALNCGVKTIEHATILSDEIIEILKKGESFIVPTLSAITKLNESGNKFSEFMKKKTDELLELNIEWLKKAYEVGLKIGFGTDAGTTDNFHGNNAGEFVYRHEKAGMKEIDILKQATIYSAEIMGYGDSIGTIKIGKAGDIIIIDGNPDENINLMTSSVVCVIKEGNVVKSI